MIEKDNYATMSPLNEGAGGTNTYMSNTPFGNIKIYDLDAEIQPIQRMQGVNTIVRNNPKNIGISEVSATEIPKIERIDIAPNVPNLPPVAPVVATETATIAPMKKPNYLLYGGIYLVVGLVAYQLFAKNAK